MDAKVVEADLDKITEIQKKFLEESAEFVYFRKGEFDNILPILDFLHQWLTVNRDVIIIGVTCSILANVATIIANAATTKIVKNAAFHTAKKGEKTPKLIGFIASEKSDREKIKKLEELSGAKVCLLPLEKAGNHRFFVNSNRFFLFIRQGENDFFGIEGTDKRMISRLKGLFEQEYVANS